MLKADQRGEAAIKGVGDAPPLSEDRMGEFFHEDRELEHRAKYVVHIAGGGRYEYDRKTAERVLRAGGTLRDAVGVLKWCHSVRRSEDYYSEVTREALEAIPITPQEVTRTEDVAAMVGVPELKLGREEHTRKRRVWTNYVFIFTRSDGRLWKNDIGSRLALLKQNHVRGTALVVYRKVMRKLSTAAYDEMMGRLMIDAERIGPDHPLYGDRLPPVSGEVSI